MRALLRAVGLCIALLLSTSIAKAGPKFRFHVPAGWIDLSPGTPEENRAKVFPTVRERANDVGVEGRLLYAAPPDIEAVMMAFLVSEADSEPLDKDALDRARTRLGWHGKFVPEEGHLETIGGLVWARFVGHVGGNEDMRFAYYEIPGNPCSVSLMFVAHRSAFEGLVATFDEAARATEGAENPPAKTRHLEVVGLLLSALAIVGYLRLRKGRAKQQAADAPK